MKGVRRIIPHALLGIFLISLIAVSPVFSATGTVRFYDLSDTDEDQEWARQGGTVGLEVADSDLNTVVKRVNTPNRSFFGCDECTMAEMITLNGQRTFHLTYIPIADSGVADSNLVAGAPDGFINEDDIRLVNADGVEVAQPQVDRLRIDGRVDLLEPYIGTVYAIYWGGDVNDTDDTVTVKSQADPTGFRVTLTETAPVSGVFRLVIDTNAHRSDDDSSPPSLKVGKDDVITLTYRDADPSRRTSRTLKVETTPPTFSNLSPAHNSADRAEPDIEFNVTDSGSGIADEDDIWVIFAVDSDSNGVIDFNGEYEFQVDEASKGDVDEINGVFSARQGLPSEVDVDSNATIYWWALAQDSAGNLAVLDRQPRIDGNNDPCYVADFPRQSLAGVVVNRTSRVEGCQPYATRIDNTGPVMNSVTTGRWWDTSKDGDDKTEYDPTKARNNSILVAFSEDLDASSVQRADFRVDGKVPLKAEVFSGREDYVFLTVPAFPSDARPSVEVAGGIFDPAGNRLGSGGTDTDGETPTSTPAHSSNSLEFLIAVLREAGLIGVLSDVISDLLSDWFIVNLIAPNTGETPDEVRERLSAQ